MKGTSVIEILEGTEKYIIRQVAKKHNMTVEEVTKIVKIQSDSKYFN